MQALLEKYEAIVRLRARADAGEKASRHELRELANAFPSALRTLDTMHPEEVTRRLAALREALAGAAPPEPWMRAELVYHSVLRERLAERRDGSSGVGRKSPVQAATDAACAELGVDARTLKHLLFGEVTKR